MKCEVKKKLFFIAITVFIFVHIDLYPQTGGPFLNPRVIYVGDPAAYILPLPPADHFIEDVIITSRDSLTGIPFPADENIDFHRIILERRLTGSRLVVEFTAFAPGVLEFPEIEIDGEFFSGLSITVNSLINDRSDRILSGSASTLAMPGTALLLYGSIAGLAVIILLTIWFFVKGRAVLRDLHERWKRYRLFSGIRKTEKRLNKSILKGADKRIILDQISDEARKFLSILTGKNCRAMTANEFEKLPASVYMPHSAQDDKEENFQITIIVKFFTACDEFRFSGAEYDSQDILRLLSDLLLMINMLDKNKSGKNPARGDSAAHKEGTA